MNRSAQHPLLRAVRLLVHTFARSEWQQIDGGKWRSSGGRVLSAEAYQRHQQRLKSRGEKAAAPKGKNPDKPAPAARKGIKAASAEATGYLKERAAAEKSGDTAKASSMLGAAYSANLAAKYLEDGNPAAAERALKIARDFASGKLPPPSAGAGARAGTNVYGQTVEAGPLLTPDESAAVRAKMQRAGKAPGQAPKPPAAPAPAAALPGYSGPPPGLGGSRTPAEPSDATNRAAYERAQNGGRKLGPYADDVDYTRPMGPPLKAPPLPGGAKLPDPSPAESAYISTQHARDTRRFGPKVADFLKKATAGVVGILTGMNGLAWGGIVGTALGGPLGLALGTAIGGGLGGRLGAWGGKKLLRASGGKGRLTAQARAGARAVLPKAAAGAVGATGMAGALGTIAGTMAAGGAVAGDVGRAAGMVLGVAGGNLSAGRVYELAPGVAKATRSALARSPAAKRRAARDNKRKAFAEGAPAALDPVALIKARIRALLARQGKPSDITIDDEPILAALALAARDDGQEQNASLDQMAESVRHLVGASRRLRRA